MASTQMATSSPNAVKKWAYDTWLLMTQKSAFGHLYNRGAIYVPPELNGKDAVGDTVNFDFVGNLVNAPIGEDEIADGNEEGLDIGNYSMVMNETVVPVLSPNKGTIQQQRTNIAFDRVSKERIAIRMRNLFDASCFNQLAGFDATSFTIDGTTYSTAAKKKHVQGHNSIVAPSSDRILRPNARANDESLVAGDTFSLKMIDGMLEIAGTSAQGIEAFSDDTFDLYISEEQFYDLKNDVTSPIQWYTNELAKVQGGKESFIENPYKNNMRAAGFYQNVYIYVVPRIAYGQRSDTSAVITTVRRAVLVGANALSFASPKGSLKTDKGVPFELREQLKDYGRKKGQAALAVYGIKKVTPSNGEDNGVIVAPTYAAAHV